MKENPSCWERLRTVIEFAGLSVNGFARSLDLPRAEELYRIKRGECGIDRELAGRICRLYPQFRQQWLLDGRGPMYASDTVKLPYYDRFENRPECDDPSCPPDIYIRLSSLLARDAELAGTTGIKGDAGVMFLRRVTWEEVRPGGTYWMNVKGVRWCYRTSESLRPGFVRVVSTGFVRVAGTGALAGLLRTPLSL